MELETSTTAKTARELDLEKEIKRLTECLAVANANHERFEREWYLRGDEIDRLQAEIARASNENS